MEDVDKVIFSTDVIATGNVSIPAKTTQEITSVQATTTGGKIYAVNNFTDTSNPNGTAKNLIAKNTNAVGYCITNNTTFFKIELDEALQVGDKITSKGVINKDTVAGVWISTETERPSTCDAALTVAKGTAAWTSLSTYTVTAGDGLAGATTIYLYRATPKSTYFDEFVITRPASTPTGISTIDGTNTIEQAEYGIIYDLMGRRIYAPQKGQIYIKNGKKFIKK